ncbi:MAG TPA: HAMP domain-containing histidine kinase [Candidatus Coprosoma intestinipullorum]|uniref:histidine kinase n=1 Tax=Candidatus Coprosoma intestinipullorum TaxID=2840752 RepID=A0A9D1CZ56_9FIRM|nr:HAMP domain-containing histidine kinase [Candidatus Coprosoma intestinipullorum]
MILENKVLLKKFLLVSIIPIIIFLIIGNIFFTYQYQSYIQNYNNKIATLVNLIEKEYPNIDRNELVSILNSNKKVSENIFSRYGIDIKNESIIIQNDKLFSGFIIVYNILLIGLALSIILLYLKHEKNQNKEIKKIVKCIEEINKKNYSINIDDNSEDELSILKNELYKITIMLKEDAENSKKDKHMLKDSLSDISHQLKTPLTSINIMLDNILDNPNMDNNTKEKFIQNIKREITNISSLVGEILKLSKFDANVIKFEDQPVFINDIVKEAISNVEMMAELKNISIKVNNQRNVKLVCDAKWQTEAITNILKNCIEHSKENSTITIDIDSNKIYKQITIRDNGEGIDEKDLPHIFERFYKGKNSSKDSVGIGLALAKTIIEKNNGSVKVDSKKGKQTTFIIKYY